MERSNDPCWTCRNRRIKCDRTGDPCAKCQKAGIECFDKRPVRWVKGVAIRGKMQGRSYENNALATRKKANKGTSSPESESSTESDNSQHSHNNDIILYSSSGLPAALNDPSIAKLDRASRYYIDYYNERICQLFIVYDSDKNPFRSLISLGLNDPILLKAVLALAARHHANTGQCFDQTSSSMQPMLVNANRDALLYKHQAVESLSRSLSQKHLHKSDSTVASIFLLIFLDLLESGSDGWNFHLEGAKKMIDATYLLSESQALVNKGPGETVQELRSFITKQLHLIETLAATFLRPRTLSHFTSFEQQDMQQKETIEHSFLGCPEYLLTAIQYLSTQRDIIADSPDPRQESINSQGKETRSMLELIENFDCYSWASGIQKSRHSSPEDTTSLFKLAQSYRVGALLYGQRIHDALTGETTAQDEVLSELLGLIDSLKDDYLMFKCVLWPIFVAGLESQGQAQRNFLVACLERFWIVTKCLNAVNAAKILRTYWQVEDSSGDRRSQWIFTIGNLGRDWLWI